MGVPITFLDKYNPEQFEIIGLTQRGCHDESLETKKYNDFWEMRPDGTKTGSSGNKTNGNPNIAKNDGKHNYFVNREGFAKSRTGTWESQCHLFGCGAGKCYFGRVPGRIYADRRRRQGNLVFCGELSEKTGN